jgi:hypothetical protein
MLENGLGCRVEEAFVVEKVQTAAEVVDAERVES